MTRQTNSPLSEYRGAAGPKGDLHRLKEHGSSSLAELRAFIRQLHGRKPSEVLGIVSGSALIRATAEATVYSGILLVVLTVVPFMMAGDKEKSGSKVSTSAAVSSDSNTPVAAAVADNPATSAGSDGSISDADARKAVEVMGLGETKTADPNKNPLDTLDNLLDDVK